MLANIYIGHSYDKVFCTFAWLFPQSSTSNVDFINTIISDIKYKYTMQSTYVHQKYRECFEHKYTESKKIEKEKNITKIPG